MFDNLKNNIEIMFMRKIRTLLKFPFIVSIVFYVEFIDRLGWQ